MILFPDLKTFMRIEIGGFTLQIAWYAVLIITGALVAYYLSLRNAKKIGYGRELLEDYFIMLMPIAIVGARIWYVLFEWQNLYAQNPISALYIWEGGLAIHGGLIAGVIFSYFYFRSKGINVLRIGDCIMPNILLAQAIGRWGNFFNQEAYGQVVSKEYFNHFPSFIKEHMYIDGAYRQPMFLYEGIGNLIGFFLITFLFQRYGRKHRGDMIFAYVVWYGLVRFWVESLRSDSLMFMGLKVAQLVSLVFIVVGLFGLLGVYRRIFRKYYPFRNQKPVVLFDADGTLIDTQKLIMDSFKHTFEKHKPEYQPTDEELISFMGPPLRTTMEHNFGQDMVDTAVNTYREFNLFHHDNYVQALPHAREMLTALKEEGYAIAVVSNKLHELVVRGLEQSNLKEFFDVVIGGDDIEHAKPAPDGLLKACAKLCVPHDDMIYVGDSDVDVKAAKNVGAYSILYINDKSRKKALEKTKPCRIIYDLNDLQDIVKEDREWSEFVI